MPELGQYQGEEIGPEDTTPVPLDPDERWVTPLFDSREVKI